MIASRRKFVSWGLFERNEGDGIITYASLESSRIVLVPYECVKHDIQSKYPEKLDEAMSCSWPDPLIPEEYEIVHIFWNPGFKQFENEAAVGK